jgi:hypothetical protein
MKIIMLLIILVLLIRCRILKLRLLDKIEYINFGASPKYTRDTKNVVGTVTRFKDGYYVFMSVPGANTKVIIRNEKLYVSTVTGGKVDLIETTIIDNISGAIIKREYTLL